MGFLLTSLGLIVLFFTIAIFKQVRADSGACLMQSDSACCRRRAACVCHERFSSRTHQVHE